MDKVYKARTDQIVALSELLADYIQRRGDVSPAKIKRITAYRFALALIKADNRLALVSSKFTEAISAVEKADFNAVVRMTGEALTMAEGVDA